MKRCPSRVQDALVEDAVQLDAHDEGVITAKLKEGQSCLTLSWGKINVTGVTEIDQRTIQSDLYRFIYSKRSHIKLSHKLFWMRTVITARTHHCVKA